MNCFIHGINVLDGGGVLFINCDTIEKVIDVVCYMTAEAMINPYDSSIQEVKYDDCWGSSVDMNIVRDLLCLRKDIYP